MILPKCWGPAETAGAVVVTKEHGEFVDYGAFDKCQSLDLAKLEKLRDAISFLGAALAKAGRSRGARERLSRGSAGPIIGKPMASSWTSTHSPVPGLDLAKLKLRDAISF